MKILKVIALGVGLVFCFNPLSLFAREFTSAKDGRKLNGELIKVMGDKVVIKSGTRSFTLEKSLFVQGYQDYFVQWAKKEAKNRIPKLDVTVSSGKSNRSDRRDNYDDRSGGFRFKIKIENQEQDFDIEEAKAKLVVFGEACDRRNFYLVMQNQKFDIRLPFGDTFEWQGPQVTYRFDEDEPALWGHKYYGYALEIKNATGTVIFKKAMPGKFENKIDQLIGLGFGKQFDKDVERISQGSTSYID